jgi:hypothetical protein
VNGKTLWGHHSPCGSDTLVRLGAHIRKGGTAGKHGFSCAVTKERMTGCSRLREMDYLDSEGQSNANRGL